MASIPVTICRTFRNNFKRHYLKKKRLTGFFIAFPKFAHNLQHFEKKKHDYRSLIISEIIHCERVGYLNVEKALLPNTIR